MSFLVEAASAAFFLVKILNNFYIIANLSMRRRGKENKIDGMTTACSLASRVMNKREQEVRL